MNEPTHERFSRWLIPAALVAFALGWVLLHDERGDHRTYRIVMSLLGAGALVLRGFLAGSRRRWVSIALILWACVIIGSMTARPLERLAKKGSISDWSFFHYYLGAKYFKELGYDGLYEQAILSDHERDRRFATLPFIRNLSDYSFEPPAPETRVRRPEWTEARWKQFGDDVDYFKPELKRRWEEVLTDRGYNATPTWNTSGWILSHLPATRWGLTIYGFVDAVLLLLAFAYFVYAFGPVHGLIAAAWCLMFYGNQGHVIARPFLHDYLAALLVFAGAVRRDQVRLAAACLAYAAMVRIFPGFFLGGLGIWSLVMWRRTGAIPGFTRRFAPTFVLSCALLVGYGCLNGRGAGAWTQFLGNISLHSEDHRFGGRRLGLQHFFTHDVSEGLDLTAKYRRRDAWGKQKTLWAGTAAVMCLVWLIATFRIHESDPLDAMLLSMAAVFAVIVLSRYYWGVGALFFVLGARGRDGPWRGVVSALLWVQIAVFYAVKGMTNDTFPWFVVANLCWIGWFLFVLIGRMVGPSPATAPAEEPAPIAPTLLEPGLPDSP